MSEAKKVGDWREHMTRNVFNWLTRGQVTSLPGNVLLLLGNPYLFQREAFTGMFQAYKPAGLFAVATHKGKQIGVCEPVFGSPMAAMYLEVLAMLGARRVIACGYVGGLLPHAVVGSYGVPDKATAVDGTSRAYFGEGLISQPDTELMRALLDQAGRRGAHTSQGKIVSIDALMLESDAMVADMQRQACSFVDLETACLFALGSERNIKIAAIHLVSDNPASKDIDAQGGHEASFGEQIQIALAVLTSD